MDSSIKWRQCCSAILPKCRSVAHLLHHSKYVVGQLLDLLCNPPPSGPSLTLRIIGVLARDLQGEIHPFFGDFMESFVSLLQKDEPFISPEIAGSIFRCMGYVFKYDARLIRSDMNVLKGYYARLLGHKRAYIRLYTSEVFALLLRGADNKPLRKHLRFILCRLGKVNANADAPAKEKEGLIDGVANLFFFLAKGVKGRMHSKGPAVLRLVLGFITPCLAADTNKERETNVLIAQGMIRYLCFHLRSPYSMDFWLEMSHAPLKYIEKLKSITTTECNDDDDPPLSSQAKPCAYILGLSYQLSLIREAILHERGVLLREHSIALKMAPVFYHLLSSFTKVILPFSWSEMEDLNNAVQAAWIEANRILMSYTVIFHSQPFQLAAATKLYTTPLISGFLGIPLLPCGGEIANASEYIGNKKRHDNEQSLPSNKYLNSALEWCAMLRGTGWLNTVPLEDHDARKAIIYQLIAFAANGGACNCPDGFPEHCNKLSHTRGAFGFLLRLIGNGGGFHIINCSTPPSLSNEGSSAAELREPWLLSGKATDILALERVCVSAVDAACSGEIGSERLAVIGTGFVALRCLPYIMHSRAALIDSNNDDYSETMDRQARAILDGVYRLKQLNGKSIGHIGVILQAAFCETAGALCKMKSTKQYLKETAVKLVCDFSTSFTALRCLNLALSLSLDHGSSRQSTEEQTADQQPLPAAAEAMVSILVPRMQSRSRAIRLMAARVAYGMMKGGHENLVNTSEVKSLNMLLSPLKLSVELEELHLSIATERAIISKLSQLEVMAQAGALPHETTSMGVKEQQQPNSMEGLKPPSHFSIAGFVANHCLGLMSAKFASVWPPATAVFAAIATRRSTENCAWHALWEKLSEVEVEAIGRRPPRFDEGGINNTTSLLKELECHDSADPVYHLVKNAIAMDKSNNNYYYANSYSSCFALDGKDEAARARATDVQFSTEMLPRSIFDDPVCDPLLQENGEGTVPFMASTDSQKLHSLVWRTLKSTPHLLRKYSKRIVSGILAFITSCYGKLFEDEPHVKALKYFLSQGCNSQIATAVNEMTHEWYLDVYGDPGRLNIGKSEARMRLAVMLEVIVECGGTKGLFGSDALRIVFFELLTRPESSTASLALRGLLAYKIPGLEVHWDSLIALVDGKVPLSEELINFKGSWEMTASDTGIKDAAPVVEVGEYSRPLVLPEHRPDLVGVVVRLLYGRFLSRGTTGKIRSRAPPSTHRTTVLFFFGSCLTTEELDEVVLLMLRNFASRKSSDLSVDINSTEMVFSAISKLKPHHVMEVGMSKVSGFLNFLLDAVDLLGVRLKGRIGLLWHVLLVILESTVIKEDGSTNVHERRQFSDSSPPKNSTLAAPPIEPIRSTCIKILSAMLSTFSDHFDFIGGKEFENVGSKGNVAAAAASSAQRIWPPLLNILTALSNACSTASSCPSLLTLLSLMASKHSLVPLLEGCNDDLAIISGLQCIASTRGAPADVTDGALSFVEGLMVHENGRLLEPHLQRLVGLFAQRLRVAGSTKTNHFVIPTAATSGSTDVIRELLILKTITKMILTKGQKDKGEGGSNILSPDVVDDLGAVLLELLWNCRKVKKRSEDEGGSEHIVVLETYTSLVPLMKEARRSWNFLSRLLGPQGLKIRLGREGMAAGSLGRRLLVGALRAVADRQDMQIVGASIPAIIVTNLNAVDANVIEGPDMELRMSAYNSLVDKDSWPKVFHLSERKGQSQSRRVEGGSAAAAAISTAPKLLFLECTAFAPVVQQCLFDLHSTELGIRVGAKAALQRAVQEVAKWMQCKGDPWHTMLYSILIPELKSGMSSNNTLAREGYIAVLANVVQMLSSHTTRTSCGDEVRGISTSPADLAALARPDDPEGDFFCNIVHLQIHRQARAFTAIRKLACASKAHATTTTTTECLRTASGHRPDRQHLTPESCRHFLIPLAIHVLHERLKPAEHTLVLEATHSLSAMAALLPWSAYLKLARELLYQLRRSSLQERSKALAAALCGLIDAWHFQVGDAAAEKEGGHSSNDVSGQASEQFEEERERKRKGGGQCPSSPEQEDRSSIHNILTTKLIPGLEEFLLMKTKVGGKGAVAVAVSTNPVSVVRPNVAVALIKLLQLLSPDQAIERVDSLLVSVCSTLRCRDSSVRDTAREALSKMIVDLGPVKMNGVLKILETSLNADGFQLPVRTYTIAALLKTLQQTGYCPTAGPSLDPKLPALDNEAAAAGARSSSPPFDECVPLMMRLLMEDLFLSGDDARRAANSGGHIVSYINKTKEAKGAKAMECLQFLAKNVAFRPSHSLLSPTDPTSVSSVHALTTPLLMQLVGCESHHMINVANEALQCLAVSFADNPTFTVKEALHYIYATCAPFLFVTDEEKDGEENDSRDGNSDDSSSDSDDGGDHHIVSVNGWNIVEEEAKLDAENSKCSATEAAARDARVSVGKNAPRLTGRDRHAGKRRKVGEIGETSELFSTTTHPATTAALLSDPAALAAVTFGLTLLNALLKRTNTTTYVSKQQKEANSNGGPAFPNQQGNVLYEKVSSGEESEPRSNTTMFDPFVMLLMGCMGGQLHGKITMLALKALHLMSQPAITARKGGKCSAASNSNYFLPPPYLLQYPVANTLRRKVTKLLLRENNIGGSNVKTISQACLKTLSTLLQIHGDRGSDPWTPSSSAKPFGLTRRMFRSLLVALQAAPLDTVQAAPWLSLAKAIIGSRVLLPEVYDLMLQFVDIAITAGRAATRSACAATLEDFLKHYPLGQKKLKSHVAKVLQGLSYPYKEGRLAAIAIVQRIIRFLPPETLAYHASLCFLSLSSRLGSDDSPTCREGAAQALHVLLSRVTTSTFLSLLNFSTQWGKEEKPLLYITAMQVLGITVEARPDVMKSEQHLSVLMELIERQIKVQQPPPQQQQQQLELTTIGHEENERLLTQQPEEGWEGVYAAACCLEKLLKAVPSSCDALFAGPHVDLLDGITANLLYPHAWVRLACCKCWGAYFSRRDPTTLLPLKKGENMSSEYLRLHGKLFLVAKQHAAQLDRTGLQKTLVVSVLKNIIWIGEAFVHNRHTSSLDHSCAGQQQHSREYESDDGMCEKSSRGILSTNNGQKTTSTTTTVDPLAWIFKRMSFMARPKGDMRRVAVFSWFKAMASLLSSNNLYVYLKCMLLPLRRCQIDSEAGDQGAIHERDNVDASSSTGLGTAIDVANDVMSLLEERAGAGAFLTALTQANQLINSSKQRRKDTIAVRAVTDPKGAAQAKSKRREQKKRQQKRQRKQAALSKAAERGYKRPRGVSQMT